MKKLLPVLSRQAVSQLASLTATTSAIGLLTCLVVLLGLGWLSRDVWEREAFGLDTIVLLWLHQWSSSFWDAVSLKITTLGDPEFVVIVVAGTLGWLWWKHFYLEARMFAIACLGALILNQGMKLIFTKSRPHLWTPLIREASFSFPSGHALGALVLYGFLAYLLSAQMPRFITQIYTIAAGAIVAIGLSRLYLGVHWPTDVIAGYAIGFLWLMLCITLLKVNISGLLRIYRDCEKER